MRVLIYVLVAFAVAVGLLMFEDVDLGLPLVNLIVWPTMGLTALLVVMRGRSRSRRRSSRPAAARVARTAIARPVVVRLTAADRRPELTRR